MSDEIAIPQPINRKPEDTKERAPHPSEKPNKKARKLPSKPKGGTSRFEPAAIPVEVPSKGFLYQGLFDDKEAAQGIIRVKPLTLQEEKILTTDRLIQSGKALDMVLESCIKSDVDPYQLLSTDRLYLLFYLRGMSYGLEYDFDVRCYHCGNNFIQTVEIDKLPINIWGKASEAVEPMVVTLPMTRATVEFRHMRGEDEQAMLEDANKPVSMNDIDQSVADSVIKLVTQVTLEDGEKLSPRDRIDFLNNLIGADIDSIRDELRDHESGIKQLENIQCPRCQGTLEFSVPLGRNFFRRQRS